MDVLEMLTAYFRPKNKQREWYLRDNVIISIKKSDKRP